jgi:NhaA family Na+:H+ antiporter
MATIGGMLFPATIYFVGAKLLDPSLSSGWAIPMATDIAFCYLVARMIYPKTSDGKQHPAILFLLLLAIADDAGGLIILAAFYPSAQSDMSAFVILVAQGIALALFLWKVLKVKSFWLYLLGAGPLLWMGFYKGGIHPALALVPLAWLMPQDTLNRMEHWWKTPVELFLGLFGFVNAGVEMSGVGIGTALVLAGLFIGKPFGIYFMTRLGQKLGMELPEGMNNKDVIIVGFAAAIGFTVALFVSVVAFPAGPIQDSVKMGALLSFLAAPLTIFLAKILLVKPTKDSSVKYSKKKSTA